MSDCRAVINTPLRRAEQPTDPLVGQKSPRYLAGTTLPPTWEYGTCLAGMYGNGMCSVPRVVSVLPIGAEQVDHVLSNTVGILIPYVIPRGGRLVMSSKCLLVPAPLQWTGPLLQNICMEVVGLGFGTLGCQTDYECRKMCCTLTCPPPLFPSSGILSWEISPEEF